MGGERAAAAGAGRPRHGFPPGEHRGFPRARNAPPLPEGLAHARIGMAAIAAAEDPPPPFTTSIAAAISAGGTE